MTFTCNPGDLIVTPTGFAIASKILTMPDGEPDRVGTVGGPGWGLDTVRHPRLDDVDPYLERSLRVDNKGTGHINYPRPENVRVFCGADTDPISTPTGLNLCRRCLDTAPWGDLVRAALTTRQKTAAHSN